MTIAEAAAAPLPEFDQRAQLRRAVIASTVGTTIEWYDFLLYVRWPRWSSPSCIFHPPTP